MAVGTVGVLVAAELRHGCAKKGSPRPLRRVEEFLSEVSMPAFGVPADDEYGSIRAEFEAAGLPIGSNDLLIAAHACTLGATLATASIGEFRRIRGLNVETWPECLLAAEARFGVRLPENDPRWAVGRYAGCVSRPRTGVWGRSERLPCSHRTPPQVPLPAARRRCHAGAAWNARPAPDRRQRLRRPARSRITTSHGRWFPAAP